MKKKSNKIYSGKLIIRIDPVTHEMLAGLAPKKFMSLNGLINSILDKEIKNEQKRTIIVSK